MKHIKKLLVFFIAIGLLGSCDDEETSYALQDVSAPTNVKAIFNIAQDDTGTVTVTPTAEGATSYQIFFGDTTDETPVTSTPGQMVTHVYSEGEYTLRIVAIGLTGLTSELSRIVTISFRAPTDLVATIDVTPTNPLEITVTPNATNATVYDIFFGESENEEATTIMAGESVTYTYATPGEYTVRIVARGAGAATIEITETVTAVAPNAASLQDFIGTWKIAAEAGSFGVGPAVGDVSFFALDAAGIAARACYIDDEYVFGADGSFNNILGAESWIEGWQGGSDACGTPVAPHNGSNAATFAYDSAASTITLNGVGAYIGLPKGTNNGELTSPANAPSSIVYSVSLSQDKNTMNVFIETSAGVFWQFKLVKVVPSPILGTWKVAPEAGSFGVGPAIGDVSFFALDAAGIAARACFIDDEYVFGSDGSFTNVLGAQSWIEGWQGGSDSCGTPVAPHDGSNPATYVYNASAGTLTLNGLGAYIALAKGTNTGELSSPANAPNSVVYNVSFENENTMRVNIETTAGIFWQFKLVKSVPSPIVGTWKVASEAGSFGVGPAIGDTSWFSLDAAGIAARACFINDEYVFGSDGTFTNVLGTETWIEGWQGGSDACGTPVAPHDGSNAATYVYDATAGTITLNGQGAYIALSKGTNTGELTSPSAAPNSIVYNVTLVNNNTMNVVIETGTGSGVFWQFKLVKD
ncbi:MAG: hypothetical protein NWQ38_09025 [Cellulophaga sp.]|nr:hypothetical protein [Cellulophaga sp.]